jgi:hypothetical protein
MPGLQPDFKVRPVAGVFGTRALAETELGKPLDLLITAWDPAQEPGTRVGVAAVTSTVPTRATTRPPCDTPWPRRPTRDRPR